jgi:hypothetical protein
MLATLLGGHPIFRGTFEARQALFSGGGSLVNLYSNTLNNLKTDALFNAALGFNGLNLVVTTTYQPDGAAAATWAANGQCG